MQTTCVNIFYFHPHFYSLIEFRHTDDWTLRWRHVLHKNIQEDPWNLPISIKSLINSLHRFVEGMFKPEHSISNIKTTLCMFYCAQIISVYYLNADLCNKNGKQLIQKATLSLEYVKMLVMF